MNILESKDSVIGYHTKWVEWASIIFDDQKMTFLDRILTYLATYGLIRDDQDLLPMTDWDNHEKQIGIIQLAGRFAEWKYYWTDDCVLTGKRRY